MKTLLTLVFSLLAASTSFGSLKIKSVYTPHGVLYYPNDGKASHPGILVLHGSEGGGRAFNQLDAQLFAMHGFAALAHCYFQCLNGMEDISDPNVEFIDLEISKTHDAFVWLKTSNYTAGKKTGIYGVSKGAELTTLLAALTTKHALVGPDAIAAHAVTDVVADGFTWNWLSHRCYLGATNEWNVKCGTPPPALGSINPHHSWKWRGSHSEVQTGSNIELEKYKKPIFFSHGTEDTLWSVQKAYNLEKRLRQAKLSPEVHIYKGEGHVLSDEASERKTELLIDFLTRSLGN